MPINAFHEERIEPTKQALFSMSVVQGQDWQQARAIFSPESHHKLSTAHDLPSLAIVKDSEPDQTRQHHIKRNETLSEIVAREFNLHDWKSIHAKTLEIAALNQIADPDKIKNGRELLLSENTAHGTASARQDSQTPGQRPDKTEPAHAQRIQTAKDAKSTDEANADKTNRNRADSADAGGDKADGAGSQEKLPELVKPDSQTTETETPREKALKEYQKEHDHLLENAYGKMSASESNQLATSVRQFENRLPEMANSYERQGMSAQEAQIHAFQEAQKTYEQINRLLEAKDNPNLPVTPQQRIALAEQTMQHAANPTSIDQGQHRTCAVNSVETRMYTSAPSEAARMVTDLATTGEYITTKDHVKVVLNKDDLKPDAEAAKSEKTDGSRDHASQLFQIGAVNVWYAGNEPNLRYEQRKIDPTLTPPDTGERIVDYSSNPPRIERPGFFARLIGTREDAYNRPGMNSEKIQYAGDQIEGGKSKDWQLSAQNVKSYEELETKLKDAKEHGKLPMVVTVHTGNDPFYTDSGQGSAGGSGGWHAVTITDYVAGPPAQVAVDNQWGASSDHLGQNKISLKEMYNAMHLPEDAAAAMEKNLPSDGTPHNQEQQFEALEVARIKHATGKISDEQLAQSIAREMSDMHQNGFDTRTKNKVTQLLQRLPCEKQLDLLATGKSDGIFTDGNVAYQLSRITHKVRQAFNDESVPQTEERLLQIKHLMQRINQMKEDLPEKDQKDFKDYMAQWHKLLK